jgi:hypothetical protein
MWGEAVMKELAALVALAIYTLVGYEVSSIAQDRFKKLSGPEIRAKFTGMEFTDEVHWGEVYGANGKLTSQEMGKKRVGSWRIEKDQLCTDYGKEVGSSCYEVWMSGKNVQLRIQDSPALPLEGVLERPRR